MSRNALAGPDVTGFNSGAATSAILVIVTFGGAAASAARGRRSWSAKWTASRPPVPQDRARVTSGAGTG
ncbi:hypothetical protein OH828_02515 [Streptomyces anulatus]|uniref:hypothetical protein n=1 Tax=Streptomyces anulatus TaxID=1892 RepID=UPI0038654DE9